MILEYHRPTNLDAALALLERSHPRTIPWGGGTQISRQPDEQIAVVDLQALALDGICLEGSTLQIGATATLQSIVESIIISGYLKEIIQRERSYNLRQMATLGGSLIAAEDSSALTSAFLALDAKLVWEPGKNSIPYGDWLSLKEKGKFGYLVTAIQFSVQGHLAYQVISKTPKDKPVLAVFACGWPHNRRRIVLSGHGIGINLILDAPSAEGAEFALENVFYRRGSMSDLLKYQAVISKTLLRRALQDLETNLASETAQ